MKREPFNVLMPNANSWDRVPRATLVGTIVLNAVGASAFATTALITIGGVTVLTGASLVGSLIMYAVTSWAAKASTPKFDSGAMNSSGLLVNGRESAAPQQFVYGEIRKGGTVTFYESTGDDNKFLHQIIVLAGHEVHDITNIFINDTIQSLDSNGFVTDAEWDSKIRVYKHLGNQTSATDDFANVSGKNLANTLIADSELTGDDALDSNFVGKGLAYLYVRYEYDREVFANGLPIVTATVQGKKVFDPRASGQQLSNPSTWTYSNNPALCIADFLYSEYGLDDSLINYTTIQSAANECDENVALTGGGTQKRYRLDGVIEASRPVGGVLEDMVTSCAGTLFYGAGQWVLKAGAYSTPVKTFTDDDFRSGITLETKISMRDNFNVVQGTFIDEAEGYITGDYPQVSNATFLSEDNNQESILDLNLPFTTNSTSAQRLAKLTLLRGREQMSFSADFSTDAIEVEVGDIVQLTHARYGFTNKLFEVLSWQPKVRDEDGALLISMSLRETSQAAFDWNASDATATTNHNTVVPDASTNSTIGSITATNTGFEDTDGTYVPRITLDWPDAAGGNFSHYEVAHKLSTDSDVLYEIITLTSSVVSLTGYKAGVSVNYKIRAVNASGIAGTYTNVGSITVAGDTIAPSAPTSLNANGVFRAVSLSWTNPTAKDLSHIEVYRNTVNNSGTATKVTETNAEYFVDSPLAGNTAFYYWLKAVDFTGNTSGFSSGANATTTFITSSDIPANTITQTEIADNSISTAKIQANAVDTNQLNADAVTSGKILAGSINSGAIAAGAISTEKLEAGAITTAKLDIDEALSLSGPTSGFLAGRTSQSDFGTDGFYIGRTSTTGNAPTGFQLSHTSLTTANHPQLTSGTAQAIIHDDITGLRIYEPVFYQRGNATGSDELITTAGNANTLSLAAGEVHTVTLIGGGGGGGSGSNQANTGNSGAQGGTTTIEISGYTSGSYNGPNSYSATGGNGGSGGALLGTPTGQQGHASTFGNGGTGGGSGNNQQNPNSGSTPANTSYGAGGGGGGSFITNDYRGFENNGFGDGGDGGFAASALTVTFDLTNSNNAATLKANNIGSGGSGASGVNGNAPYVGAGGGAGASGVVAVTGVLDGYIPVTISTLLSQTPPWDRGVAADNNSPITLSSGSSGTVIAGNANNGTYFSGRLTNASGQGTSNFTVNGSNSWVKVNGASTLSNRAFSAYVSNNYAQGGSSTTSFNLAASLNQANNLASFGCTVEGYLAAGGNINATYGVGYAIIWDDA